MKLSDLKKPEYFLVLVASLGYFVDIYDLILFNVVKKSSLEALGFSGAALADTGIFLFNMQMTGMLVGGILWGVLGDTKGRLRVLFGSILMYSLANIANAFVGHVPQEHALTFYAIVRFFAGVGLAGELGAGITLVSETLHKEKRGYGTMAIVTVGALGAVVAAVVAKQSSWQTAYWVGGLLGLGLLALRVGTLESKMFKGLEKNDGVKRGAFFSLFTSRQRLFKYLSCILIGLPVWFIISVLIGDAERFAKAFGVMGASTATAVMYSYIGLSTGDLFSGLFSQWFRSRKKVVIGYLCTCMLSIIVYLYLNHSTVAFFYFLCFVLGMGTGYWALFVTIASEQFGTNIRSTVTTTVPNFVRGAVVPITLSYKYLANTSIGLVSAALVVGITCVLLSVIAILYVQETFSKDLDYIEVM